MKIQNNILTNQLNLKNLAIVNIEKYYSKSKLVKIRATFDGYRKYNISEFYFNNGKLYFVFKSSQLFDTQDIRVKDGKPLEQRIYVKNNKVIKWLNNFNVDIVNQIKPSDFSKINSDANLYKTAKSIH